MSGTPPLVFRRTYLSRDCVSRHFGVGTTHNGELYLRGDGVLFQWVELILATGTRIRFAAVRVGASRSSMPCMSTTPRLADGCTLDGAVLGHSLELCSGPTQSANAILTVCGPGLAPICSIVEERDADGHVITYRRDADGRLLCIQSGI